MHQGIATRRLEGNNAMWQPHMNKLQVQRSNDLHEYVWAETDIFATTVCLPPKADDCLRVRFEWGF
jgi:hypothetical protein